MEGLSWRSNGNDCSGKTRRIFNYHNNANCQSGSSLFSDVQSDDDAHPKPQDVGSFGNTKFETLFGICFSC